MWLPGHQHQYQPPTRSQSPARTAQTECTLKIETTGQDGGYTGLSRTLSLFLDPTYSCWHLKLLKRFEKLFLTIYNFFLNGFYKFRSDPDAIESNSCAAKNGDFDT